MTTDTVEYFTERLGVNLRLIELIKEIEELITRKSKMPACSIRASTPSTNC